MKIAYITYQGQTRYTAENNFDENVDLLSYLIEKGLDIEREIWNDPEVNWAQYDVAVLKSPWDYHQNFEAFNDWLDQLESLGIRLLNTYDTVRWNMDKHYLKEITAAGYDVIPSLFLAQNTKPELSSLFESLSSERLIIKPCISGGSKNTIALNRGEEDNYTEIINGFLLEGSYIVQPFMEEISEGEWSFVFFNGEFSHCLIKKPQEGDFRVQQFFGGTIHPVVPEEELIKKAQSYLQAFGKDTFYARVDGLIRQGKFILMELELIEPYLYLAYDINSITRYHRALLKQLHTS